MSYLKSRHKIVILRQYLPPHLSYHKSLAQNCYPQIIFTPTLGLSQTCLQDATKLLDL